MTKKIYLPQDADKFESLTAGETVHIYGVVYTARDAAHKRLCGMIENNEPLPFALKNQTIYYAGPCPAPSGRPVGSVGPTTSARVDGYTPLMLENGLRGMIGKGERNGDVIAAIKRYKAAYFAAIGGAGALYAERVKKAELIAFPDLLSEAVYRFEVEDFPAIVAIDCRGGNIYD